MLLLMLLFRIEVLHQWTKLIVSAHTRVRKDVQGCLVLMGYRVLQALCSCYP